MEQEKKRIWFPYLSVDYKAAEERLNELGAQGWRLTEMANNYFTNSLPVFQRESRPLRYCVVLSKSYPGRESYLDLCAEAGWRFICCADGLDYFISAPGERPVPLETDPVLERRKALRRFGRNTLLFGGLTLLLVALWGWLLLGRRGYNSGVLKLLQENHDLLLLLVMVFWLAVSVWWTCTNLFCWLRCRRMGAPPVTGQRRARVRGAVPMLLFLLYIGMGILRLPAIFQVGLYESDPAQIRGYPVITAAELGLGDPRWNMGYLRDNRSVLLHALRYEDSPKTVQDQFLGLDVYCERYACRWNWLAVGTEHILVWQEGTGRSDHSQNRDFHAPLDFAPAELGFDAAWIAHGEGYDTLILRQGNITACIEAPADLTDPALLARVAGRLELEGSAYG